MHTKTSCNSVKIITLANFLIEIFKCKIRKNKGVNIYIVYSKSIISKSAQNRCTKFCTLPDTIIRNISCNFKLFDTIFTEVIRVQTR